MRKSMKYSKIEGPLYQRRTPDCCGMQKTQSFDIEDRRAVR